MDPPTDAYALLDAGGGRRLERFGALILDRPAPATANLAPGNPAAWGSATARFERRPGAAGGRWEPAGALPQRWTLDVDGLPLELRPTPAGQVGFFPEHLAVARWAADAARSAAAAPKARPRC